MKRGAETKLESPSPTKRAKTAHATAADGTAETKRRMQAMLTIVATKDATVYNAICDAYGFPQEKRDGKKMGVPRPAAFRLSDVIRVKRLNYKRAPKTDGVFMHLYMCPPKAPVLVDMAAVQYKIKMVDEKGNKVQAAYSGALKYVPTWIMAGELIADGAGLAFVAFDGLCAGTLTQRLEHISKIKFTAGGLFHTRVKSFVPADSPVLAMSVEPCDGQIFALDDCSCAFPMYRSLLKLKEADHCTVDLEVDELTWSSTLPVKLYSKQGTLRGTGTCQDPDMRLAHVNAKTGKSVVECLCIDRKERRYQILFERSDKAATGGNVDRTIDDTLEVQSEQLTLDKVLSEVQAVKLSDTIPLDEMKKYREDFTYIILQWVPLPHAELELRVHSPVTEAQFKRAVKQLGHHVANGDFSKTVREHTVDTLYHDDIDQYSTYRRTVVQGRGEMWIRKQRKEVRDFRLKAMREEGSRAVADEFIDLRLALSVEKPVHARDVPTRTLINPFDRDKNRVSSTDRAGRVKVDLTVVQTKAGTSYEMEVEAVRTAENLRDPLMADYLLHALALFVGF